LPPSIVLKTLQQGFRRWMCFLADLHDLVGDPTFPYEDISVQFPKLRDLLGSPEAGQSPEAQ
jgi:hypothetical protein